MSIKINVPDITELKPRITVIGVGGAGGNAINNMIAAGLEGVNFVAANTDAQALAMSSAEHRIQMGVTLTEGLGAGSHPEVGEGAAEEAIEEIRTYISGSHMVFVAAGMGGGTGTGAAPVIAKTSRDMGILTVGVVTKPFQFEGQRRMIAAEKGLEALKANVDTLIVIPNQNLFRIANEKTTFADAFKLADQVLHSGIACITDLIIKDGLINLDFADVRTIMKGMGTAMMGTGEASGDRRALQAAEEAICNPLLDDVSMRGAKGLLISITGGADLTLYEVDEAASRIREDVDSDANVIVGATFDETMEGRIRVSIVASGVGMPRTQAQQPPKQERIVEREPEVARVQAAPTQSAPRTSPYQNQHQSMSQRAAPEIDQEAEELMLDEEIERYDPPRQPAREKVWQGPGDVTIEKRTPHLRAAAQATRNFFRGGADRQQASDSFVPEAPANVRRRARTMPDVEDFPEVGQRELRARSGQVLSHGSGHEQGKPKRKLSIFERLARVGKVFEGHDSNRKSYSSFPERSREVNFSSQEQPVNQSYASKTSSERISERQAERDDFSERRHSSKRVKDDEEGIEIPSFLHRDHK